MRKQGKLAIAVTLALVSGAVLAQENPLAADLNQPPPVQAIPLFDYAIGLGVGHTDNVNRSATDEASQSVLQPAFNFMVNKQGSTLQAQIVGLLRYTDYLQGYYGNEFRGQLTGTVNWVISPQRLNFVLQDYSSVEPVNTRVSNSPINQQQVNVFNAGPTLLFRLGSSGTWNGQADLRYINTAASKNKEFASQRGLAALRLLHDVSPTSRVSFNLEGVHVDYNNVDPLIAANRYDQYNLYVRLQRSLQRVDFDLALGGSRVEFSQGWQSHSGGLARASLAWRMDPRNTLQLTGLYQISDATTNLTQPPELAAAAAQLTNPTFLVGRTVISSALFRDRSISAGYQYQGPRFGFTLSPYYTRLVQLNGNSLSRDGYGTIAGITYLINPVTSFGVTVGSQTSKYPSDGSRDRDDSATVNLLRQLNPHWDLNLALRHEHRDSSQPSLGYTQNEVFVYLYYRR
ncbi:MAG TPA: hypothetical protein VFY97_04320 [Rhodanobacteraceae bacterium]|nr:hypothetical protein [Rhodanobacteraceae bacterium]